MIKRLPHIPLSKIVIPVVSIGSGLLLLSFGYFVWLTTAAIADNLMAQAGYRYPRDVSLKAYVRWLISGGVRAVPWLPMM